jgi:signal transduction histidine kinase
LGLIPGDIGRPVAVFRVALIGDSLIAEAQAVLEKLTPVQTEVNTGDNQCYLRRILPYRTDDKRIDGVIVTFTDITESKQAASALDAGKVEAAALERRVEERTRMLRALAFQLTRAEESERQAIARDLHDDLGQLLSVAKIRLAQLERSDGKPESQRILAEAEQLIDRAERSVRSLAFQLSPAVLYELGLGAALQWLAEEMKKTYGLTVELSDDGAPTPLSQGARAIVFRAVRELLINVVKHANAAVAQVSIRRTGDGLVVTIRDFGAGFDTNEVAARPGGGFGLTSVRERLSFIGGSAQVESSPGDGTRITLTAPLQTEEQAEQRTAK